MLLFAYNSKNVYVLCFLTDAIMEIQNNSALKVINCCVFIFIVAAFPAIIKAMIIIIAPIVIIGEILMSAIMRLIIILKKKIIRFIVYIIPHFFNMSTIHFSIA